jgi:peptidoglycan/xylan/chitin deacetylase (PgdA/CDA1 family)
MHAQLSTDPQPCSSQYGSRAGVWRILRLLKSYSIKCTSYMIGMALEQNPEVGKWLEREGCEIACHGWRWVDRSGWSEEEEVENIRKAVKGERSIRNVLPSCLG